ncbi:MAG: hypothetical protein A3J27_12970 [Candidatus Tectomicrobia bacterium RIFCSPLOWO2_12_FULL_69_37]|nr:MAG: hypothetical protein A3I72_09610 [Candidatus Tectomicrobia bacterium RIFCSPLOWO2_02_FULL_70_19]OGL69240.1 MAG: hypothetical protein A3J27_12970 [Candidatus Tectomicrobia bacterium RIFCSPLOWO2_12_FULL_69_37]
MRKWLVWAGAILLSGCAAPSTDLLPTLQPSGGPFVVFQKPYEIVFAAAVRVVNLSGETISEASIEKGRIVTGGSSATRGVFFFRLPNGRTRVELSAAAGPAFFAGPEGFFTSLREQIVAYEKKEAIEKERRRESEERDDLRGFVENPKPR